MSRLRWGKVDSTTNRKNKEISNRKIQRKITLERTGRRRSSPGPPCRPWRRGKDHPEAPDLWSTTAVARTGEREPLLGAWAWAPQQGRSMAAHSREGECARRRVGLRRRRRHTPVRAVPGGRPSVAASVRAVVKQRRKRWNGAGEKGAGWTGSSDGVPRRRRRPRWPVAIGGGCRAAQRKGGEKGELGLRGSRPSPVLIPREWRTTIKFNPTAGSGRRPSGPN